MSLADFERLLRDASGLDAASLGSSAIERAVKERADRAGTADLAEYWARVSRSEHELQELIEAVVVGETWFFRDREAFAGLKAVGLDWIRAHADGVMRILSLPCSTGEEPYSVAMSLLDAGIPARRFYIDAVDISERALAHARRATYGKSAFRGGELDFRDRYFEAVTGGYRLSEAVRQPVHFQQGNLFSPAFLGGGRAYDVIFCRNLLIYFDRPTQDRAIALLGRLLASDGVIFVGSAETGLLLNDQFSSAKMPRTYAFRRATAGPATSKRTFSREAPRRRIKRPAAPAQAAAIVAVTGGPVDSLPPVVATGQPADRSPKLDEARRLADEGHFVEAVKCCEEHIRLHGPSAQPFYILGLVRDASGNHAEAMAFYRKALYLEPGHEGALIHLALLMEEQGRGPDAQVLRNRLQRLGPAGKTT